jgi:ABC-type nitrate/sulfonate/bicarbonate transport system ATPase subunit
VSQAFDPPSGRVSALNGIDLDLSSGELVVVLGRSGSGKSTLLNVAAGLLVPTSGCILFDGQPAAGPGPERATVFQGTALLPWLSVYDSVFMAVDYAEPALSAREKQTLTGRFLKAVGLASQAQKRPHQLSAGMRQRVAVACAFAGHPRLLLLDDPFAALDVPVRETMQHELLKLRALERRVESVLLATRDPGEAIYLADRIVVLTDGPAASVAEVVTVTVERSLDRRKMAQTAAYRQLEDRLHALLAAAPARGVA